MKIRLDIPDASSVNGQGPLNWHGYSEEARTMDNMRRVLVFKLIEGDFKKYKSLESKLNEIGEQHGEKIHRRQWNEKDKTCEVDISFRSEEDLIQDCIKVTELLSENGLKKSSSRESEFFRKRSNEI